MKIVLDLDDSLAERLLEVQQQRGLSFDAAVNDALRRGLMIEAVPMTPYRMPVKALGLEQRGTNIDRIRDFLDAEDDRRDRV